MKQLLLAIPILLASCVSGQTRDERLESVAWEFADAAVTLRELAPIYQTERPELAERIVALAVDLERVSRAVEAVRGGTMGSGTALETLAEVLDLAAQTWPEDPDVQAGVALARAALRRAERELAK